MATSTVDFSNMTAAQIKEFIESQPAPVEAAPVEGEVEEVVVDPETGEPFEQPRDENGRFVSTTEEEEEFEEVVEKEIDLNDGSGVQIFRGVGTGATREEALINAHEALTDELAKAQRNATAKIRELSQRRETPTPAPVYNPEQEANLSQRLLNEPSRVLQELREETARTVREEIRQENERKAKEAADAHQAAVAFIQATPDYNPCPENQDRISRYMDLYRLPMTTDGIRQAYEGVKDLLKPKPAPAAPAARPRSSGLSTRRSAAPPVVGNGFDEKAFNTYLESQGVTPPSPIRRKF